MRLPEAAMPPRAHPGARRYQIAVLLFLVAAVLVIIALQAISDAYTNYLWYRSVDLTMVWRSMVETKLGLGAVFAGSFFVASWTSLYVVDALAPPFFLLASEQDLSRRYRTSIGRYPAMVRTVVSLVLAVAVGLGATSQWKHWLLFENGGSFGVKDPQFGRDVGFFVFRLPFLSFLVDWTLVALLLLLLVAAGAHYLAGSLRAGGPTPRTEPHVIAHLSFILSLMALVRAAGYFFVDRYALDLSNHGLISGADYVDVHVRLPALSVLAVTSMVSFVLLTYNVYHRTWVLPAVAVGMWAFVAFVAGVLFPAMVQWLQVSPAQSKLEQPYIERNIAATRAAFSLGSIVPQSFGAHSDLDAGAVNADRRTLEKLPLWDQTVAWHAYRSAQDLEAYYRLSPLASDRYRLGTGTGGSLTPVVVGVRQLRGSGEPGGTWVSEHLVYTHGYGAVISPATLAPGTSSQPAMAVSGMPVSSVPGAPKVAQPDVYYGSGAPSYVIVDTRQPELNYVSNRGKARSGVYHGTGGVLLKGFWQRATFAMRFHDLNLLTSGLVTTHSRLIFDQNVRQLVAKAAPFLTVDSHPYPVVAGGRIYWMVDCYTTSQYYPYSESARTGELASTSSLNGNYNYIRDSVKAVVNAYSGQVSFYAVDPRSPVLLAWEHAFPGMIQPLSAMRKLSPALLDHLRYPQDLLSLTASMYGRYHFAPTAKQAQAFYSAQDSWSVGNRLGGSSYQPTYQLLRLPGRRSTSFEAIEPLVPGSATGVRAQHLAAFLAANSNYKGYGSIVAYKLPRNTTSALSPEAVTSKVERAVPVRQELGLVSAQHGSVVMGRPLLVPIDDALIYVQPVYVRAHRRAPPSLKFVAAEYGSKDVGLSTTLSGALQQLFGKVVAPLGPKQPAIATRIDRDLASAYKAYKRAEYDRQHGKSADLRQQLAAMGQYLRAAQKLLAQEQTTGNAAAGSGSSSGSGNSPATGSGGSAAAGSGSGNKSAVGGGERYPANA